MPDSTIHLSTASVSTATTRHNGLPPTSVHPLAVAIPVACFAWFLLAATMVFDRGYMSFLLVMMGLLATIFFALMVGGGGLARSVTPEERSGRSFSDFVHGDVSVYTGHLSGSDVLWQVAAMPALITLCATALFICAAVTG